MTELVRFALDGDGDWAVAEVDDLSPVIRAAARGADGIVTAAATFEAVMAQVRHVSDTAIRALRESAAKADEIEIEFGIALNAQAGAVMVKSGVDAHLQVRLSWKRPPD
jgi:hypothetical protein